MPESETCSRRASDKLIALIYVLPFALTSISMTLAADVPPATIPKFELNIRPILTAHGCNAGACHGKARGQNGFALSLLGFDPDFDYSALVEEARGRRISPSAPGASLLLRKISGETPHRGGIRIPTDSDDYRLLLRWIESGTPRVNEHDARLAHLTFHPAPHPLSPNGREELRVIAHYSDESTRDVTATCAYLSNDPAVVSVESDGRLTAGQLPGEAVIMARYMDQIATWSTAVVNPVKVDPAKYAALPRRSFIDDLAWKRLAELNLQPSEPVADAVFLRRAFLDVIGRLPSAHETRTFLNSTDSNKRPALIDELLVRPEYADFWANKWADLLRPNPYHVGIKATLSLDGWLRDAFRRNLPYDQFVRQLLTAKGSTWRNGAATIFRDKRTPDEILPMISQLFLGIRLECAKCHQHPFEIYGQKDFYSLAAFFARVGRKGDGISAPISGGEETIFVLASGDVRHPLTGAILPPTPLFQEPREIPAGVDPREAFVDWATASDHPTFAHIGANRIWSELFGIGIVDPVDDLRATNPPSNPALLDALASEFRRVNFDQKQLLKTILNSQVYALSSKPNETNGGDARNFSRHYRRRLRAEVLMDAVCDLTGIPDNHQAMPAGSRATAIWTVRGTSEFLDAFGRQNPNQDPPCERVPQASVVQALHLMNASELNSKIRNESGRAHSLSSSQASNAEIIEELYLATYNRFPTANEQARLTAEFEKVGVNRRELVEDLMWAMINTPEFVYQD